MTQRSAGRGRARGKAVAPGGSASGAQFGEDLLGMVGADFLCRDEPRHDLAGISTECYTRFGRGNASGVSIESSTAWRTRVRRRLRDEVAHGSREDHRRPRRAARLLRLPGRTHLVALVRAGAKSENGTSPNDPANREVISKPHDQGGHETGRHVGRNFRVSFGCLTGVGVHGRTQVCRVGR